MIKPSLVFVALALLTAPACFVVDDKTDDDDSGGSAGEAATGGTGGRGTAEPGDPCTETEECVPGSICFNEFCVGQGTLRISLAFTTDSDFDLHVETPTGAEINYSNRTANGGTLDVDQCISSCGISSHVENVVFEGTAPAGAYAVWVANYDGRAAGDFTIEIAGDVNTSFAGTLPAMRTESTHYAFTR